MWLQNMRTHNLVCLAQEGIKDVGKLSAGGRNWLGGVRLHEERRESWRDVHEGCSKWAQEVARITQQYSRRTYVVSRGLVVGRSLRSKDLENECPLEVAR